MKWEHIQVGPYQVENGQAVAEFLKSLNELVRKVFVNQNCLNLLYIRHFILWDVGCLGR